MSSKTVMGPWHTPQTRSSSSLEDGAIGGCIFAGAVGIIGTAAARPGPALFDRTGGGDPRTGAGIGAAGER